MSQSNPVNRSFKAAADLSSYQYHIVKMSAGNTVNIGDANCNGIGILQNKPSAANEAATVAIGGTSKMVAGEAIAVGKMITCKSDGHGEVADAAAEFVIGMALEAASADGDIIEVLICHFDAGASDA
jgi:hypothetical protein